MATHTNEDLDYALNTLETLGKEFGIIGKRGRHQEHAFLEQPHFGISSVDLIKVKQPRVLLKVS
jgi:hypothetical protein